MRIKNLDQAPKVILLTAIYKKPTYKWEVMDVYGADEVLLKPTKPTELLARVEKHLLTVPARYHAASNR